MNLVAALTRNTGTHKPDVKPVSRRARLRAAQEALVAAEQRLTDAKADTARVCGLLDAADRAEKAREAAEAAAVAASEAWALDGAQGEQPSELRRRLATASFAAGAAREARIQAEGARRALGKSDNGGAAALPVEREAEKARAAAEHAVWSAVRAVLQAEVIEPQIERARKLHAELEAALAPLHEARAVMAFNHPFSGGLEELKATLAELSEATAPPTVPVHGFVNNRPAGGQVGGPIVAFANRLKTDSEASFD
jgi:hypothetical protein